MNFENMLPVAHSIVERVWVIWGFHTTVVVAVFGWLISKRNKDFPNYLKKLGTTGYSIFYLVVTITFLKTYLDIKYVVKDLLYFRGTLEYAQDGYIAKLLTFNFWERVSIPLSVCTIFLVIVLILIWNDKIWEKLKQNKD